MRVWLVTIGEPLPLKSDIRLHRTGLVAEKLIALGHEVVWWTSAFDHQQKKMLFSKDETISLPSGIQLEILRGCGYKRNVSLRRYLDHRIVAGKFRQRSKGAKRIPDVIVAATPCYHLAYEAVRYSITADVPVLVDVRDLWPDIFWDVLPGNTLKKLARWFLRSDYERLSFALRSADGLLSMSNGILQWALDKAGRPRNQWDAVFYLAYQKTTENLAEPPTWGRGMSGKKVITYIGSFGKSYELSLILDVAAQFWKDGRTDALFVIAGAGEQEWEIRKHATDIGNIVMPGWINAAEIQYLLRHSYCGLIPCRSVVDAIPNKTFEYYSEGVPVISSLEGEMSDLIEGNTMGINYQAGSWTDLYDALCCILNQSDLRDQMSRQARSFYDEYGAADRVYGHYSTLLGKIADNHRPRLEGVARHTSEKETNI